MKKLLFTFLFYLSFFVIASAKDLELICTVDDRSFYDTVKIFEIENPNKAMILFLNERDLASGDVAVSSTSYSIRGDYNIYSDGKFNKIGVFKYLINRSTGSFQSIISYDGSAPIVSNGNCIESRPKF